MQVLTDQVKYLTEMLENKMIIIQKLQDENLVRLKD